MTAAVGLSPSDLASRLRTFRYHATSEADIQRALGQALTRLGIPHIREHVLTARDRLDFLVSPDLTPALSGAGLGIEVKVGGSAQDAVRQVHRYLQHDALTGILLVTTRLTHRLPDTIGGKPVAVLHLATW